MANIVPDSFKTDLLGGVFDFDSSGGSTFKLALYTSQAGFSTATTAYTTTNEVSSSGTNYTAGGNTLTNNGVAVSSNIAFVDFADSTFSSVTTVTLVMDAGDALDSGLTEFNYGILSATSPSIPGLADADWQNLGIATLGTDNTHTGKLIMSGKAIDEAVHSEAAHATTSDIWTGGNTCLLTGAVVTFTDVADAPQAGAVRYVVANDAHIITDNAALEVDGNANYTCASGDLLRFEAKTTSTFRVSVIAHGDSTSTGFMIQRVNTQPGSSATGTTGIPYDDTIPQNTEGNEFMTLAITPTSATTRLKIDVVLFGASNSTNWTTMALFQDSTADALAAVSCLPSANWTDCLSFSHTMTSGTTSETTFKVRASGTSGTFTFNGSGGTRKYGGVAASSITITEYNA